MEHGAQDWTLASWATEACGRLCMAVLAAIRWAPRRGGGQQSGQGRLGRQVGCGWVGEASGPRSCLSNRRDGERAVWPVVSTKPPHLLNSSLRGLHECSLQLGQSFRSSQFLSCFKGPQRRSETWVQTRTHTAM